LTGLHIPANETFEVLDHFLYNLRKQADNCNDILIYMKTDIFSNPI